MDVLSASYHDDKIAWYENDGSQNFTLRTVSQAAHGAFSLFAADVDGDGDMDVLSASYRDDKIAWYENSGSQNFTPHTISTVNGANSVFVADVDGDGDMDVLTASTETLVNFGSSKVAWYENDGGQNFTLHTISTAAIGAFSVISADVDGDMDVLSTSRLAKPAWYENDGKQSFTERTIGAAANGAYSVFVADVDGDGDLDVLSTSSADPLSTPFGIAWYENLLVPEPAVWYGDTAAGSVGDGTNWGDPDNWTVDGVNDQSPAKGPPGDDVTFATGVTTGMIDLGTERIVNTATFQADYALNTHTLTVTTGQIEVQSGVTASIGSNLASGIGAGIVKQGSGTLVVMGTAPDVILDAGTLEVTSTATINSLTTNGGRAIVSGTVQGDINNLGGVLEPAGPGDFNLSGELNARHIDAQYEMLHGTVPVVHASFDLVPDGVIDEQDVDRLIHDLMHTEFGDANLDGDVDVTDFDALARNFDPLGQNTTLGWGRANFDGDADVDISDFNQLARNFSPRGYRSRSIPSSSRTTVLVEHRRTARTLVQDAPIHQNVDELPRNEAPITAAGIIVEEFALHVAGKRARTKTADRVTDLALAELTPVARRVRPAVPE